MDYAKNKKYFKSINLKYPIITIVFGVWLMSISVMVGLLVAAIGGGIIVLNTFGKPSDSEIDLICLNELENIIQQGLKKIGLDEEEVKLIAPITISGPYFKNISTQALYKLGGDKRWRSSNFEAIVLFFSEKQVYSYNYRFSLIENEKNESTDEYFYKDIVSVSTSSDTITVTNAAGKSSTLNYEQFKLTTSGGTSISCSVWDMGSVEKSIQGMKQLLREKKSA